MIRGKEGTPVTLGFQREGVQDLLIITLLRGRVEMNPVPMKLKITTSVTCAYLSFLQTLQKTTTKL